MKTHNGDMPVSSSMVSTDKFTFKPIGGLSKRELFAMAAMQGILSDPNYSYVGADTIASYSVEAADALLAKLDKDGGE